MTIGEAIKSGEWIEYLITDDEIIFNNHPDFEKKKKSFLNQDKSTNHWKLVAQHKDAQLPDFRD